MRIATISEGFYPEISGVTIAVAQHLGFLARRGHEQLLLHPRYPEALLQRLRAAGDAAVPAERVAFDSEAIAPHREEARIPTRAGAEEIDAALARFAPDVVIYHNADRVVPDLPRIWRRRRVAGVDACRRRGVPAVPIIHTLLPLFVERSGQWLWRTPPAAALVRRIFSGIYNDGFEFAVTVSPAARGYLQGIGLRLPILAGPYNGVDTELFRPRAPGADRPGAGLRLCWIGRLTPEKNAQLLPELMAALLRLDAGAELALLGDGPLTEALRRRMPAGAVRFCGWLSPAAVAEELSRADAYLSVSDTDCSSLTANEALASGVPVLAPDTVGFQRLAGLGAGMLYPPGWLTPEGMGRLAQALHDGRAQLPGWAARAAVLAPTLSWEHSLRALYTDLGARLGLPFLAAEQGAS
jgi:phosphatidylinositol alpha 1,6-mannosyltransferase